MKPTIAFVNNRHWGPDDDYLVVEVQVDSSEFKAGDKVVVSVRKAQEQKVKS